MVGRGASSSSSSSSRNRSRNRSRSSSTVAVASRWRRMILTVLLFPDRFHDTSAGPRGRMAAHWALGSRGGIQGLLKLLGSLLGF